MSDLLELADRCEAATELQTRAALIDAAEAMMLAEGRDLDNETDMGQLDRFEQLIEAEAYLDAAMTLIDGDLNDFSVATLLREAIVKCLAAHGILQRDLARFVCAAALRTRSALKQQSGDLS